ncbi:hypothetical protein PITC_096130 [Penicillium italicum]|uniref:Uncharacterized protein n=1 Tax=Penicillium italicum TaxID=40296 RepID=A0A0A2KXY5_PENIT|nr:hypothetical protein PITC_096130 [Penicillium italicum]
MEPDKRTRTRYLLEFSVPGRRVSQLHIVVPHLV